MTTPEQKRLLDLIFAHFFPGTRYTVRPRYHEKDYRSAADSDNRRALAEAKRARRRERNLRIGNE